MIKAVLRFADRSVDKYQNHHYECGGKRGIRGNSWVFAYFFSLVLV
jgi:hypothetical protein